MITDTKFVLLQERTHGWMKSIFQRTKARSTNAATKTIGIETSGRAIGIAGSWVGPTVAVQRRWDNKNANEIAGTTGTGSKRQKDRKYFARLCASFVTGIRSPQSPIRATLSP